MATVLKHTSPAPAAAVWALWSDTGRWPVWDPAIAAVAPAGLLAPGMRLQLSTTSGTTSKARIVAVTPGSGFVERTRLPLARVLVTRTVVAVPEGSLLTATVAFGGLVGGAWGLLLGTRLRASVGSTLRAVARAAESA